MVSSLEVVIMIFVTFVGIAAALTIPQVQNYAKRQDTQIAISKYTAPFRTEIQQYYESTGSLPFSGDSEQSATNINLLAGGVIRYALKDVDQEFRGASIALVPLQQAVGLRWQCRTVAADKEVQSWLPTACRNGEIWAPSPEGSRKSSMFTLVAMSIGGTLAVMLSVVLIFTVPGYIWNAVGHLFSTPSEQQGSIRQERRHQKTERKRRAAREPNQKTESGSRRKTEGQFDRWIEEQKPQDFNDMLAIKRRLKKDPPAHQRYMEELRRKSALIDELGHEPATDRLDPYIALIDEIWRDVLGLEPWMSYIYNESRFAAWESHAGGKYSFIAKIKKRYGVNITALYDEPLPEVLEVIAPQGQKKP